MAALAVQMKTNNLYIYALIFLSFALGIIEVLSNLQEKFISQSTQSLWGLVFVVLTIIWAYYDAPSKKFQRPFSFGFLVYLFWPIAFPYYLIKTRGIEGLLIFMGFLALLFGPWLAGLVAYAYYT